VSRQEFDRQGENAPKMLELTEKKVTMMRALRVIRDVSNRAGQQGVEPLRVQNALQKIFREADKALRENDS
jgi:hypothetical protein